MFWLAHLQNTDCQQFELEQVRASTDFECFFLHLAQKKSMKLQKSPENNKRKYSLVSKAFFLHNVVNSCLEVSLDDTGHI